MAKLSLSFLFVCVVIVVGVNSKAVTRKTISEMEAGSSVSKNLAADLLNNVLVKSRQSKHNLNRVTKRAANDWLAWIIIPPYCVPSGQSCPCGACGYCCKGKCNKSNTKSKCSC